jgi:hypothetical protein
MRKLFYTSLIAFVLLFAFSCKKDNSTPNAAPVISYDSFVMGPQSAMTATLTFNFSDADGDIGLQPGDTTGSYATGSVGYYDFYMRYYWKNYAGNFVTYYFPWNTPINGDTSFIDKSIITGRIPYINNTSKVKSLSGQIIIPLFEYIPAAPYPPPPPKLVNWTDSLDHFKYEFWIYDRAGHKSNVVTTPEFDISP